MTVAAHHHTRDPRASRTPRRRSVSSSACIIPNGTAGAAHLAIYHPATARLTYSGAPTGAGWRLACQLARLLHAKPSAVSVPDQIDALDRAAAYADDPLPSHYRGLTQHQLEVFWSAVMDRRNGRQAS